MFVVWSLRAAACSDHTTNETIKNLLQSVEVILCGCDVLGMGAAGRSSPRTATEPKFQVITGSESSSTLSTRPWIAMLRWIGPMQISVEIQAAALALAMRRANWEPLEIK